MFLSGGGYLYGNMTNDWKLNSENGIYIYPDFVTGYNGVFKDGVMVKGKKIQKKSLNDFSFRPCLQIGVIRNSWSSAKNQGRDILFEYHRAVVPFVELLDHLGVCLPIVYSRLLTGIPILAVFQNLRWISNITSLLLFLG